MKICVVVSEIINNDRSQSCMALFLNSCQEMWTRRACLFKLSLLKENVAL